MTGTQFVAEKHYTPKYHVYTIRTRQSMVSAARCLPSAWGVCSVARGAVRPLLCRLSHPPPCARLDDLPSNPSPNLSTPLACSEWLRSYLSPLHHYCGVGCLSRVGSSTNSSYIDCYIHTHSLNTTCKHVLRMCFHTPRETHARGA